MHGGVGNQCGGGGRGRGTGLGKYSHQLRLIVGETDLVDWREFGEGFSRFTSRGLKSELYWPTGCCYGQKDVYKNESIIEVKLFLQLIYHSLNFCRDFSRAKFSIT